MLSAQNEPDWGIVKTTIEPTDSDSGVDVGQVGRIQGGDSHFYWTMDFWGYRRTLSRSVICRLRGSDWPVKSPVYLITLVLELFERAERLHRAARKPSRSSKVLPFLRTWQLWRLARLLRLCESYLLCLHNALSPSHLGEDIDMALELLREYPAKRPEYPALPRHFAKHLARVALALICPEFLQTCQEDTSALQHLAVSGILPLANTAVPLSFSLLVWLWGHVLLT